jgi:hypothetical protein
MRALISILFAAMLVLAGPAAQARDRSQESSDDGSYSKNEVVNAATRFFGGAAEGVATVVEKAFRDHGRPNAYIMGDEASGAIGVGLRYGQGKLVRKGSGSGKWLYWQGPSLGFDLGGNASKVFMLVYNLGPTDEIFQRFPGVEGSYYFVAGVGMHYMQSGRMVLAPMRTGVGLRAGVNMNYIHITREKSFNPF